jgi:hypothetical protein
MPKRICSVCGKEKDVQGGKVCEKGHFICKDDVWSAPSLVGAAERKICPLDSKPLR